MQALVIDDSATVRRVIRSFLATLGFETREACDGREGLEELHSMPEPDLVVVDWNMPEMDGIGFIRRMRSEAVYDRVPVLMVTTESELSRVTEALNAGAGEYVMKPFTEEMLREKLAILGVATS